MKRANIKILALLLSLIVLPPLMWELKSQVGVVPGSGGVPNDAVQGGSNLTVTGAVPYVSSSGTLSQDTPALHWDATNNRLGLGTASPGSAFHLTADGNSQLNAVFRSLNTYAAAYIPVGEFLAPNQSTAQEAYFSIGKEAVAGNRVGMSFIYAGSGSASNRMSIGNFFSGVSGPIHILYSGSVGIGPSNTSPSGTLHVYDATATTGVTTLTVRAGAGQGSTVIQQWLNSGGGSLASLSAGGYLNSAGLAAGTKIALAYHSALDLSMSSDSYVAWRSVTSVGSGSADLGLSRSSANNLGITNGSSTEYTTIGSNGVIINNGRFQIPTSTPASAAASCTAGTISWDTSYVYVCTATNTWKRASIATW